MIYHFTFESEYGVAFASYRAKSIANATKLLKEEFPHDHGADGFWTTEDNDDENPINW